MHKSRLGGIIIDCQNTDPAKAGAFWGQVFGYELKHSTDPADAPYAGLETPPGEVSMAVQNVEHPSRIHIDIETDDIEAEAQRLEALGARRIEAIRTWLVMEAPTGHRFCLVPPEREGFEEQATQWP